MHISNPEILLALRAPDSNWLGVLTTVLDEATRDPSFDARQREILAQMLGMERIPSDVCDAASRRAAHFENELCGVEIARREYPARRDVQRPKLTLVGNAAG
jgi:plasmid stability protein